MIDMEGGRLDTALLRAGEALAHAEILELATEMMLANLVLVVGGLIGALVERL